MLDPDMVSVEANRPSGGSSATPATGTGKGQQPTPGSGASSAGGATGTAAGTGSAAAPSTAGGPAGGGGATSVGGLDPSALANCVSYCNVSSQARPCANNISNTECLASCTTELARTTPYCQKVGASLLECLVTVYKNSSSCSELDQLSVAKCSPLFTSYQNCAAPTSPVPTPIPTPPPPPAGNCSGTGSAGNGKCSADMRCANGARYSASCFEASLNQLSCSCNATFPDGSGTGASFTLNESLYNGCEDSLAVCGFPQLGLK